MKCKVLSNLDHDGALYVPGDEVELTEAQVTPLLPDVVEPLEEVVGKKTSSKPAVSTQPEGGKEPEGPTYKELQEKAASLGLKSVGVKKDDLVKLIAEAEAAEDTKEEDTTEPTGDETDEDPGADL